MESDIIGGYYYQSFVQNEIGEKLYICKKTPISLYFRLFSTFTLISLTTTYITYLLKCLIFDPGTSFI